MIKINNQKNTIPLRPFPEIVSIGGRATTPFRGSAGNKGDRYQQENHAILSHVGWVLRLHTMFNP